MCTASASVPVSTCPFEDDVVVSQQTVFYSLPTPQMTCEAAFAYVLETNKENACDSQANFQTACCNYCKSKDF